MSQRVTLDHPSMDGRARQGTNAAQQPHRRRRVPVDSVLASRAGQARKPATAPKPNSETPLQIEKVQQRATTVARRSTESIHGFRARRASPPKQPVEAVPEQIRQVDIAMPEPPAEKANFWQTWKSRSIYGMAMMLFVVGMGVAVSGFIANNKANEQIEVLGAVLESGDEDAIRGLAESLPNEDEVNEYDINNYKVAPEKPRYLRIPSLGIGTTRVLETGVTHENAVDTPAGIFDTSWYNGSASVTDESGAMFVVGHYVGPSQAGIFFNLEDMNTGSIIEIEQGDGTLSHFRVVEKMEYSVDNVDMAKALSPVNPDRLGLNLMTCGGNWDVGQQQYDHRTLVRAEKI